MARKASNQPTDVELHVLRVLWQHGPSAVGRIHELLSKDRDAGYSTTLKMIQVMHHKRLLTRDESTRPFLYHPTEPREKTQTKMLNRLVDGAFGGAMSRLLINAISSRRVSAEELEEIKRLIHEVEQEQRE